MRWISMAFLVLLASMATAASAHAEVRSGTSEGGALLRASYDDVAGTLFLTVTAPPGSAPEFSGRLDKYCSGFAPPADAPPPLPAVNVTASAGGAAAQGGDGVSTGAPAFVSDGGAVVQTTLASQALAGDDFRCLEGTVGGVPVLLYFDGFRHESLTASGAEAAVKRHLIETYGDSLAGRPTYLACPQKRLGETALCRFQLGRGDKVRVGTYIVAETEIALNATRVRSLTYSQKARRCAATYQRDEMRGSRVVLDKKLVAPRVLCGSKLVRYLVARSVSSYPARRSTMSLNQTPAAGFEPLSRYKCTPGARRTGGSIKYRWRCKNRLGDKVAFNFLVSRKTASRPQG
jgi:hypothetical protein